jgi:multidrug efflux pump subunit AcrA (membrane-fusion protein)
VRTIAVQLQEEGEKVSLTGEIQPRYQADLGFRVNGKILDRPVDVGTRVKTGDLLAWLDPQQYKQDLEVAKS